MKKISILLLIMASTTIGKGQITNACNGDPMVGTRILTTGESQKLITYKIKHAFTIMPTVNYAPIIRTVSYNHAWVTEPAVPCSLSKVKPNPQGGSFKHYGKDTIINSTPYNNQAIVDTLVKVIENTGGTRNDSAFANTCNSRSKASTCIAVDAITDSIGIKGVIQSYGFAQAINPTINTNAYAFSWCGVSVEDGQPLKQGDVNWKPGIVTGKKGKTRNIRQKAGSNDPINFNVFDFDTGLDTSGTLLSIVLREQLEDDTLEITNYWLNDTVHIESDSILFRVEYPSPFTSKQGFINLLVQNGFVIQSQKTGVFSSVPLPFPGTPVPFSFPFMNSLSFHYNLDTSGLFNTDSIRVRLFLFGNNENSDVKTYDTTKLAPTPQRPSCNGGSDGAISLYVNYGKPPYFYSWSNGATTKNLTNISSGIYTVFVIDSMGMTASKTVTVADPPLLTETGNITHVTCKGAKDGAITVIASGGTPPYKYLWQNGSKVSSRSNLAPKTYIITVTDSKGCTVSASFTVLQSPVPLTIAITKTNIKCNGGCGAKATVTPSGGTPLYDYLWNTGATTSTVDHLCAGTYVCTITDAFNCVKTKVIVITEPPALSLLVLPGTGNDATALVSGGTPPYTFKWFTVPMQTTATATGLIGSNTYKVKVTDFKGCTKTVFFTMPVMKNALENADEKQLVTVYPNPVDDQLHIGFTKTCPQGCRLEIVDVMGRTVYRGMTYKEKEIINIIPYDEGLYLLKITYMDKVIVKRVVIQSIKK